jgi:signal transduction histidine kinase
MTHATDTEHGRIEQLVAHLGCPPRSLRALRYRGDDRAVSLSALSKTDRTSVQELYASLLDFDAQVRASSSSPDEPATAKVLAASFDIDRVLAFARSIGNHPYGATEVRHTLHDARGGALTSLLIEVQRAAMGRGTVRGLRTLVSDHLKVMRNAMLELDDARRVQDLVPCEHSIGRLAETLSRVMGDGARGTVSIALNCTFLGGITASCVELGALDRAALNVVNNAVRHSARDRVDVALLPTTPEPGCDLRIVVANAVEPAHAAALRQRFGDDLSRIFIEPFSTTGSGEGLKICVDFVSAAYGLVRYEDTVRASLVGALLDDTTGSFVAWLHWPAIA